MGSGGSVSNRPLTKLSIYPNNKLSGKKNNININFLVRISCGRSRPYARMPRGQKASPHHGAAGKPTFWCGRPRFSARTSMKKFALIFCLSVHTRCIVKMSGFTRGFVKIGDFIKFKASLVEFLENRRSRENQKPPENRQKSGLF